MPFLFLPTIPDEKLFPLLNIILPAWAALILIPRNLKLTSALVNLSTLLVCVFYALVTANVLLKQDGVTFGDMMSYEGIVKLLSKKDTALPAWSHFCAFDLWTARWIAEDAVKRKAPQVLLAPVLLLTMFLGPCGLLAHFLIIRPFFHLPTAAKAKHA